MSDKLRIKITASQVVRYSQIVEMSEAEWADLKSESPEEAASSLEGWLDTRNVHDADPINEDDFEAMVVDANGKPFKPIDEYVEPI